MEEEASEKPDCFLTENLKDFDYLLTRFKQGDELYLSREYYGNYNGEKVNITGFGFTDYSGRERLEQWGAEPHLATNEDKELIRKTVIEERAKFEKRLHSYIKRYGTSKLKTWTFWADE